MKKKEFYVGCTRAENLLFVSHSAHLTGRRKTYDPTIEFKNLESFPLCTKETLSKNYTFKKKG